MKFKSLIYNLLKKVINSVSLICHYEQLCSETPLFGDRTDEVIKWTKSHILRIADLLYE